VDDLPILLVDDLFGVVDDGRLLRAAVYGLDLVVDELAVLLVGDVLRFVDQGVPGAVVYDLGVLVLVQHDRLVGVGVFVREGFAVVEQMLVGGLVGEFDAVLGFRNVLGWWVVLLHCSGIVLEAYGLLLLVVHRHLDPGPPEILARPLLLLHIDDLRLPIALLLIILHLLIGIALMLHLLQDLSRPHGVGLR
jgi:hypothetical protein